MQRTLQKRTLHNWWRTRPLVFHPETTVNPIKQMKTMEDSTDISGLVLYQTLFYLLEKITTSFGYNTKFKIQDVIFNVSRNIIK